LLVGIGKWLWGRGKRRKVKRFESKKNGRGNFKTL